MALVTVRTFISLSVPQMGAKPQATDANTRSAYLVRLFVQRQEILLALSSYRFDVFWAASKRDPILRIDRISWTVGR